MNLIYLSYLIIIFMPLFSLTLNLEGAKFCNFPTPTGTNVTDKTFFINGHKDFGGQRIIYNGQKGTCNPNIPKNWESVIIIQDGGSVSNVILGASPDGTSSDICCLGSCTLNNVFWENVCWRAASFRAPTGFNREQKNKGGTSKEFTYTVNGGGALDGFQKIFDQSGPGKSIINKFCAANCEIALRSCGDCGLQYQRGLTITDSKFMGPGLTIIGANANLKDQVTLSNVEVYGYNNPKTKIAFACSEYNPPSDNYVGYEPGKAGTGTSCKYGAGAVTVIN
ncbi:unnamed protein product [Meloidogyne enterolobii]|uniref:Uncharacterized protein n=1 Tax=Meloidogyne enterolobii TaxID=390850 RepID=A0ACB1A603_MELEN